MRRDLLPWVGCIPIALLLIAAVFDRWRRNQAGHRTPLSEKLLRPPGFSLQNQLARLNDRFTDWTVAGFLFSFFSVGIPAVMPNSPVAKFIWVFLFALIAGICTVAAWRTLISIRHCRSGWLGEQAMAEQLAALLPKGYLVFHDLPRNERPGFVQNIDHVVVGPAGVFAIETKCRTKRPGPGSQRSHEAVFDGETIRFPWWRGSEAASQSRRNAKWLAGELSKATAEKVEVQPIVALPGWLVTRKANSDIKVLSGKEVSGYIASEPAKLSAKLIQQIAYQLEQRCRDVEF